MVAHMNAEALGQDDRKRRGLVLQPLAQNLWKKGESSGHVQRVVELRVDCDQDALWLKVEQQGEGACHTGRRSCFYRAVPLGQRGAVKLEFRDADKASIRRRVWRVGMTGRARRIAARCARAARSTFITVDSCAKLNTLDRALMGEFIEKVEAISVREDLRAGARRRRRQGLYRRRQHPGYCGARPQQCRGVHRWAPHLRLLCAACRFRCACIDG